MATGRAAAAAYRWKKHASSITEAPALAAMAMLMRVGAGISKYIVWMVMAVIVQYARRTTDIVPKAARAAEGESDGAADAKKGE